METMQLSRRIGAVVLWLAGFVFLIYGASTTDHDVWALVTLGTTLGAAAIFNPLRIRVQRWVDRRFNRSRYDRERIAEQFAGTLRDDIELEGLIEGWLGVAVQTMQPRTISVWTRVS